MTGRLAIQSKFVNWLGAAEDMLCHRLPVSRTLSCFNVAHFMFYYSRFLFVVNHMWSMFSQAFFDLLLMMRQTDTIGRC